MIMKKEYVISAVFVSFLAVYMVSVFASGFSGDNMADSRKKVSDSLTDEIFAKQPLLEFNGFVSRITGVKINSGDNTVSKIDDKYLTYVYDYMDTAYKAKQTLKFKYFLDNKDIDFFMVMPPFKVDKKDKKLIESINDSTNKMADEFIHNIKDEVNVFDMRDIIEKSGKEYLDMFFIADHHWKPQTGLAFVPEIAERLNKEYGFKIDVSVYNKENFNTKTYEKIMLGSQGRKVTRGYAELEDMDIITPKYDYDFEVEIPDKNIKLSGGFEDVFIDKKQLEIGNYYDKAPYTAYCYGDKPYIHIKNNSVTDDRRVLILKDSYSSVVVPYLAMQIREIDLIDLRYYDNNIRAFIEENKPDTVIMMYHPAAVFDENLFRLG